MATPSPSLTLTRVRATGYRSDGDKNFLVELHATDQDGQRFTGTGESRPRGASTGDLRNSWEFLAECLRRLEGRQIALADADAATDAVRAAMVELAEAVPEFARSATEEERAKQRPPLVKATAKRQAKKWAKQALKQLAEARARLFTGPYHGTLSGVECALMDLIARAQGQPVSEVFGKQADRLRASMPTPFGEPGDRDEIYERVLTNVTTYVAFPNPPAPTYEGKAANLYEEVPYLKPLGSNGTKGHLLEREALILGLTTTRFSKGAFVATDGVRDPLIFKWSRGPRSSAVSLALCTHKEATRLQLARAGVPVPRGRTFTHDDFPAATAFAERIGYPVVFKPAMGVRGIGVVANIQTPEELQRAFDQLANSRFRGSDFIVEQHVMGRDYRIVVIGDEVIAAILREPASVDGDGEHTIAELIINKNTARRLNPHLWGRPIKYGDAAMFQLERAGLSLTSVPAPEHKVLLSSSCSLSQGGDSIDVLDELHPSIKEACIRTVKAVPGLWFCGIDFLLEDHTKPLDEQQAGICELNAHAAIGNCEYPLYGAPRPVARTYMQQCIEHFGLSVWDKPADKLALKLTIRGQVTRVGFRRWMERHAEDFGITGWIRNVDEETVEAVLAGDAVPVSALAAATVLGPKRARPNSVATEHITPPETEGFQIIVDTLEEQAHAR